MTNEAIAEALQLELEHVTNTLIAANQMTDEAMQKLALWQEAARGLFEHLDDSGEADCPVIQEYREMLLGSEGRP